jgi:hypothetical protein
MFIIFSGYMGEDALDVNFSLEALNANDLSREYYDSAVPYSFLSDIEIVAENGDDSGSNLATRLSFTNDSVWDQRFMLLNFGNGALIVPHHRSCCMIYSLACKSPILMSRVIM